MERAHWAVLTVVVLTVLLVGSWTSWMMGVLDALPPHADLVLHACSHAALVITLALATRIGAPLIFACSVGLAIVVEVTQGVYVPGRTASVDDIVAATLGSTAVFARQKVVSMLHRTPSGDELPV